MHTSTIITCTPRFHGLWLCLWMWRAGSTHMAGILQQLTPLARCSTDWPALGRSPASASNKGTRTIPPTRPQSPLCWLSVHVRKDTDTGASDLGSNRAGVTGQQGAITGDFDRVTRAGWARLLGRVGQVLVGSVAPLLPAKPAAGWKSAEIVQRR